MRGSVGGANSQHGCHWANSSEKWLMADEWFLCYSACSIVTYSKQRQVGHWSAPFLVQKYLVSVLTPIVGTIVDAAKCDKDCGGRARGIRSIGSCNLIEHHWKKPTSVKRRATPIHICGAMAQWPRLASDGITLATAVKNCHHPPTIQTHFMTMASLLRITGLGIALS